MIFGVLCVDISRKFRKNPRFRAKSIVTIFEDFESISTEVGSPPEIYIYDYYLEMIGATGGGALISERFLRGGDPTSVEILSKISKFVEILFCQK